MYGPRGSIVSNDIPWVNQQMPGVPENLAMDKEISFAKKNRISISNNAAVLLLFLFFACCAATGLLVFYFAPCSGDTLPTQNTQNAINEILMPINDTAEAGWTTTTEAVTTDDTATTTAPLDSRAGETRPPRDVRLPRSVKPKEYDLKITPFFTADKFNFVGDVRILVNVTEPCSNITLHSNELVIDEGAADVFSIGRNESVKVVKFDYDKELQFFVMNFDGDLEEGEYAVYVKFSGLLNDALQGFYKSSYKKGNETRWTAATQFQPTDARRAFPCFDEPSLKATFKLTIGRPNEMNSISNMPKIKSEISGEIEGYTFDYFEKSVPMSTYLVAFVISDFKSKSNDNFSVWARADALDQTAYSLEIGPKVLKYYETFFGIPFPLPKIDMVAVPDFSSGAMENWGLITYRESNLLYEDGVSSKRNKQSIAIVVAHELAHQWFGNLVTPTWWTDLWLNEGFASYLEYVGVDAVNPSWKMLDQFILYELQLVFSLDALQSSHQVSIEVNNPDEVNDIFDKISYGKGATLIRMMEHFLSTEVFKRGLTKYLNDRKYGSATQDDLWMFLTNQAHEDGVLDKEMTVKEIMDTWTLQTGFPVVTVTRNYEDNSVTLKQTRFLLDQTTNSTTLWWIPITYTDATKSLGQTWMRGVPELSFHVNTTSGDWLLFNVNLTGYYRVNYDEDNWKMISAELNKRGGHLKFDPKNRAQIVDDALNLANAGYLDYGIALEVTSYLYQEKDFVPWSSALKGFDFIYEMFLRSGHFDKYKDYLLKLITPLYFEVGYRDYSNDPLLLTYVRSDILQRACALGFVDCLSNAARLFQNWKASPDPDNNNPIPPNLRNVVYCTAIKAGGEEEWNFAWDRYLKTNVGTEKDLLLTALACTRESWLLNKYLDMSMTPGSGIRKQDTPRVFAAVARNIVGQPLAFKYLTSNWDKIKEYMGQSFMFINNIIRSVTMHFNSEQEIDDLKNFAHRKNKDLSNTSRSVNQAIEQTEANIAWMQKYFDKIATWLEEHNKRRR